MSKFKFKVGDIVIYRRKDNTLYPPSIDGFNDTSLYNSKVRIISRSIIKDREDCFIIYTGKFELSRGEFWFNEMDLYSSSKKDFIVKNPKNKPY